ncbi:uncharacterized protein V6R79_007689 [Siganus canaliculatus]
MDAVRDQLEASAPDCSRSADVTPSVAAILEPHDEAMCFVDSDDSDDDDDGDDDEEEGDEDDDGDGDDEDDDDGDDEDEDAGDDGGDEEDDDDDDSERHFISKINSTSVCSVKTVMCVMMELGV